MLELLNYYKNGNIVLIEYNQYTNKFLVIITTTRYNSYIDYRVNNNKIQRMFSLNSIHYEKIDKLINYV